MKTSFEHGFLFGSIFFDLFLFLVPFKYEALMQDYLSLGSATDDKNNQYAPVYPMFCARPSKRRQLSEQSLGSASEKSDSEPSLSHSSSEQLSIEWNEWSSEEFSDLVIGDTDWSFGCVWKPFDAEINKQFFNWRTDEHAKHAGTHVHSTRTCTPNDTKHSLNHSHKHIVYSYNILIIIAKFCCPFALIQL